MAVPSPSLFPTKAERRAALRAERRVYAASLDPATRIAMEEALAALLVPLFATARIVAAYQPMKEEVSPLPALARAAAAGCTTVLPAFVARDSRMTFHAGEAVEPGPWGLLQPSAATPPLSPDLVLAPLVGCDRAGNRIGMGQGHYDRALEGLRGSAKIVGLGWDFQLLDDPIPADSWDQPLDAFASPSGLTRFAR